MDLQDFERRALQAEELVEKLSERLSKIEKILKEKSQDGNNNNARNSTILPIQGQRNVLITSALPYVNNVPHLGNIIGSVLSGDVFARYCRARGHNVLYICGTDEYGTATETKAIEEGLTPKQICDKYFAIHKGIYDWFQIDFDYFGRTSTEEQTKITQDIFTKLQKNGFIFEDSIQQLYCEKCQRFLADRFVEGICPNCSFPDARGDQCDGCGKLINSTELKEPRCKLDRNTPIIKSSDHLFIDLPKLKPIIEKWLSHSSSRWSNNAQTISYGWLKDLQPRCITRDLKWGTPIPIEKFKDKVFYVWFDACFGYISITANYTKEWEKWWKNPKEVELYQFMGKDNIPFHTILFPGSLLGTEDNYTLLHSISATEYLNFESGKFSKSRGIGVFGDNVQQTGIPADIWRFYLLRNRPETSDSAFSWVDFAGKYNGELINTFGNFVNRILSFCVANFKSIIPPLSLLEIDETLISKIDERLTIFVNSMEKQEIKEGLNIILQIAQLGNQYLTETQPWNLIKENQIQRCGSVIALGCNIIYCLAGILAPFMPVISEKLNEQLNIKSKILIRERFILELKEGHKIGSVEPLFAKLEDAKLEELKRKFAGKRENLNVQFVKQPEVLWPCVILLFSDLKIRKKDKKLEEWKNNILGKLDIEQIIHSPHVEAYTKLVGTFDQGNYPNSVLNLATIFQKDKRLPNINTFVDIYNTCSLSKGVVSGAYERNSITGNLSYAVATGKEYFIPINQKQTEKIQPGEWVLKDSKDIVITKLVTKQSASSVVNLNTKSCVMCIQGNPETSLEYLQSVAKEVTEKIREICGGESTILHAG